MSFLAHDIRGAEDAINAELGVKSSDSARRYSQLTAEATLQLDAQAMDNAIQYYQALARIERLGILKRDLYSDPAKLFLDHLDRNPRQTDLPDTSRFQRLALEFSHGREWWYPLLDALEDLSGEASPEDGNLWAASVLVRTIKEAAPDLFEHKRLDRISTDLARVDKLRHTCGSQGDSGEDFSCGCAKQNQEPA